MKTAVRERTLDAKGKILEAGTRVTLAGESGQLEGTIVRVLDDYGVVTVLLPEGRGQAERMVPLGAVEATETD